MTTPATTPTAPAPVAPPPIAAPAVVPNAEEKQLRQLALRIQQEQQALAQREAALREREAKIEKAKQIGVRDLDAMFDAVGVPPEKRAEQVSAWGLGYMREGKAPTGADAGLARLEAELAELKRQQAERTTKETEAQQQAQAQLEEQRAKFWYGELQTRIDTTPECRLTKVPFLGAALDEDLQKYQTENNAPYQPVFTDRVKSVELAIAKELNTKASYFQVRDGKVYDADGKVTGIVTAPPAEVAPAAGAAPAVAAPAAVALTPKPVTPPVVTPTPAPALSTPNPGPVSTGWGRVRTTRTDFLTEYMKRTGQAG